ncbi:MAG: VanZ family protein [Candidatus Omnitrophica bacterium]|nr:VanZ family protein [Candidatus Omnitrophota bacterium]
MAGAVTPVGPLPERFPWLDKAAHLCEYLVFAWLLRKAVYSTRTLRRPDRWLLWLLASGYGLGIEGLQALLPWRSAEWADVAANALGAACVSAGIWSRRSSPTTSPIRSSAR